MPSQLHIPQKTALIIKKKIVSFLKFKSCLMVKSTQAIGKTVFDLFFMSLVCLISVSKVMQSYLFADDTTVY